jgi:hypothetical protein
MDKNQQPCHEAPRESGFLGLNTPANKKILAGCNNFS